MANRLDFFLGNSDSAALLREAGKSQGIEKVLRKSLPDELAKYCSAGRLIDGRLSIYVDNGAVASKLRQLSARILEKLKSRGLAVDALKISVRVNPVARIEKKPKPGMGRKGMESFRELADSLDDSPLKSSIESLIEKLGNLSHQDQPLDDIE